MGIGWESLRWACDNPKVTAPIEFSPSRTAEASAALDRGVVSQHRSGSCVVAACSLLTLLDQGRPSKVGVGPGTGPGDSLR
jgi:hypothetical protein